MAKNALFRRSLFGYAKEDVNDYIAKQDLRIRELGASLAQLQEQFETHRRFYETLMRVYDENLKVLREVQIRAGANEERVRALSGIFAELCAAYSMLYRIAGEQQAALVTAKQYEDKATKYDDFARRMKEMVLPASMQETVNTALSPLPQIEELPLPGAVESLSAEAERSLEELLGDARAFYAASARLKNPAPPQSAQSVG